MSETRRALLLASVTSFALFVLLGVAVHLGWSASTAYDGPSAAIREWAVKQPGLEAPLLFVERVLGNQGMAVATAVLAGVLLLRRQVRSALLVVVVMFAARELTQYFKDLFGRDRPAWQDPDLLLQSGSYPSSHAATVVAFAALVLGLTILGSRRRSTRGLVGAGALLLVLVVCADRVLLGRHYPTDLLGGALLGTGLVLLGLALLHPLPVARERDASLPGGAPLGDRELEVSRAA
ncbi:phosphatase PAP2 family protein [Nocardioides antri]|uniref:Phosphatase PAP2 family protein n=1 Tax=Nocardioides antri TaxID=2607659 RepID=A0A5B1M549_9ACTN|nr:phosphatase PAP2 family protein [Nocardioides antri]KAA1428395.1 phosphatase PAP2 family protein [Nocardioides antri]